jgi:hypothetical protein
LIARRTTYSRAALLHRQLNISIVKCIYFWFGPVDFP